MDKLSSWLFVLIAVVLLLSVLGVGDSSGQTAYMWIELLAFAVIGLKGAFAK